MNDEQAEKGHLFPGVLKDDSRIIRLTAQAVGRHHHGQIIHIHLSPTNIHWLSENLDQDTNAAFIRSCWCRQPDLRCWDFFLLPVRSWWSSTAPICWVQEETEPHRQLRQDLHNDWYTAYRSSEESQAPPALCTTTSTEMLRDTNTDTEITWTENKEKLK